MTCPDPHPHLFTKWSTSLRCEAKRQWDQSAFALWAHNAWHKLAQRDISAQKISGFRRICLQCSASLHWLCLLLINKPACHFINPVSAFPQPYTHTSWNTLRQWQTHKLSSQFKWNCHRAHVMLVTQSMFRFRFWIISIHIIYIYMLWFVLINCLHYIPRWATNEMRVYFYSARGAIKKMGMMITFFWGFPNYFIPTMQHDAEKCVLHLIFLKIM